MPFETSWYVPDQIIIVRAIGDVTHSDITMLDQTLMDMLEDTDSEQVHGIIDSTLLKSDPGFQAYARMQFAKHPRCGWVVEFGLTNALLKFAAVIANHVLKLRYRQVSSLNDALEYIKAVDHAQVD